MKFKYLSSTHGWILGKDRLGRRKTIFVDSGEIFTLRENTIYTNDGYVIVGDANFLYKSTAIKRVKINEFKVQ